MVSARCGSGRDWHLVAPRLFTPTDRLHLKSPMAGNPRATARLAVNDAELIGPVACR
ncbi:hypothetical protein COCHEDRAFT_1023063 [Bipolaris maydis C5]|uniref:Uncharacterized protein n=1 Tax=Cochliobolus heterostrophus (strain C5 / ATCC 48332 / race O) TaxID=701091 RepID=M2TQS7_COCH5|nr:hypothetical protein COCHEDRAFT_1023063 [Bipolaris maydis C5]